jgi:UDP-N-acetylmuramate: L-alanyl-gamma-D-glutamyl-meso-diaminopimelate ligase
MHIYFMGIGGTAMGSVAILLKDKGYQVSGSDQNLYPPMSDQLDRSAIEVFTGYDEKRLEHLNPDLVVIGNVIGRGNPEAEWLLDTRTIPFISLPQLIGEQLIRKRHSIVITGTHGKTTTTALTTHLLKCNGTDPGYLIAGVSTSEEPSSVIGNPHAPFVIEGDEYDCAFFDKRSKFIHYLPKTLVINNLEFDHGDIFRDFLDIQRSFSHLVRLVPRNGHILINGDDEKLVAWVTDEAQSKVWKIGFGDHNDVQIEAFEESAQGSQFALRMRDKPWMQVTWSLAARYNAHNAAMAALATALQLYPDAPERFQTDDFSGFSGVKRRQQLLHESPQHIVYEDFAHHPTAVRETIISLKNRYPGHRIWCAFEPRSNTSRSPVFQNIWPNALSDADQVWIGAIHRIHLLQPNQRLNTERLAQELITNGTCAKAYTDNQNLQYDLNKSLFDEDQPVLLVFFSNGSFDGIIQKTVAILKTSIPD